MLGSALSAVIIVSLVGVGFGALTAPRRSATLYGIVLEDERALAFIRAMGVRDLVIGGLLAVIAWPRGGAPLGWSLCLTAVVPVVDYVVVAADRRAPFSGAATRAMDPRVLHGMGAVGHVFAGGLLLAGY
jgi:hypothetical protein